MADSTDRRAAERMPVNAVTGCSFAGKVEDCGQVKIRDVSLNGIGMVVSKRVEAGSLLVVTVVSDSPGALGVMGTANGSNPGHKFAKTLFVKVAHVTPIHGGFLVGGTFIEPLTYQELTTLVL